MPRADAWAVAVVAAKADLVGPAHPVQPALADPAQVDLPAAVAAALPVVVAANSDARKGAKNVVLRSAPVRPKTSFRLNTKH